MFADYSAKSKLRSSKPFRNGINSEITGWKLTKFGKISTEPSSVHKELSYGEKIAKIGLVYPEIFDKIRQFFGRIVPDVHK